MDAQSIIARRVARELRAGNLVNLGIGIPTLVANFVPSDLKVFFQSENGLIGTGPMPEQGMAHPLLTDAGGRPISALPGACVFDSAMSLVTGAKRVIVAMQHAAKGKSKIVQKCALPLTSSRPVDLVVTDMAVIGFSGGRMTLLETAPGITVAEVLAVTEADLYIPGNVPEMKI